MVISGFQALPGAKVPVTELEPATEGSLQISRQIRCRLCHRRPTVFLRMLPAHNNHIVHVSLLLLLRKRDFKDVRVGPAKKCNDEGSFGFRIGPVHNKVISGFQVQRQARGTGGGARTREIRLPADLKAASLANCATDSPPQRSGKDVGKIKRVGKKE
ncbi:hypothetical protein PoB_004698700 [Plakobranchus ocellatus]|uniref:Uncharacterized protein n=1 Tax=Plakobranchus ocellatus TaxID=259542 RepID=A0AAV4BMC5_9GAST|nr:hypothetical protein PoB_004698700 [Plakobranchus ocellatus]